MDPIVIIGASHAGVAVAAGLRKAGYAGEVLLVSAEAALPYHRPPLSKAYLKGEKSAEQIALRGEKFYTDNAITLLRQARATAVDAAAKTVVIDGVGRAYSSLILATGARARPLPGTEAITQGLSSLRDLADADALRTMIDRGGKLIIVGGGFIGLEVAATAVQAGLQVTVIEPLPALLRRALPAEVSDFLLAHHRAQGVDIRLNTGIDRIEAEGSGSRAALLTDGTRLEADHILIGIGSSARLDLAETAELETYLGGIKVDTLGRTSAPDIYALGDCATQWNPWFGDWLRLESVQAATDQAAATALALCGKADQARPHETPPWFWSDQYALKLQMVGFVTEGVQTLLRGAIGEAGFSILHLRDGRLVAAFSVNRAADHIAARRLIASGTRLDPTRAEDATIPLAKCAEEIAA